MGKKALAPIPPKVRPLLPPSTSPTKKTVILDLDNTLIYTTSVQPPRNRYDFQVKYTSELGLEKTCYVVKRPGVDLLLQKISKDFEIVAFTAGTENYASKVLDLIDPEGLISHRLYRDSCKMIGGRYFKDLTDLGRDVNRVVAVDDRPDSYLFESLPISRNVFPVSEFTGKNLSQDQQLAGVAQFLLTMAAYVSDTRDAIRLHRALEIEENERRTRKPVRRSEVITCFDCVGFLPSNRFSGNEMLNRDLIGIRFKLTAMNEISGSGSVGVSGL
ncbi:hypothetical protein ACLOJK_009755 [Asimina triloba]